MNLWEAEGKKSKDYPDRWGRNIGESVPVYL